MAAARGARPWGLGGLGGGDPNTFCVGVHAKGICLVVIACLRVGRKAQPPPAETAELLRRLLERKQWADDDAISAADELALATLRAVEEGASGRQVALAVGVSERTVRDWIAKAQQLRGG